MLIFFTTLLTKGTIRSVNSLFKSQVFETSSYMITNFSDVLLNTTVRVSIQRADDWQFLCHICHCGYFIKWGAWHKGMILKLHSTSFTCTSALLLVCQVSHSFQFEMSLAQFFVTWMAECEPD